MTLISSISGIRGTVNGTNQTSLTPIDVVRYVSAYGTWINTKKKSSTVVVGRDGRISGKSLLELVKSTLISLGINVIDTGLSTTPTTQIIIKEKNADGGIILTASHNPKNWNALKLFNSQGEFIIQNDAEEIFNLVKKDIFSFNSEDNYGQVFHEKDAFKIHINNVINLSLVNEKLIKNNSFKIVVDGINSSGGVIIPKLLEDLGAEVIKINCKPDGNFSHNPEPLDKNLSQLKDAVLAEKADLGIAVDPDVDRLVFVCDDGVLFGEENTIVACCDFVLSKTPGSTVSNMSSSMSLQIITNKYGCEYYSSKVGEVNVVEKMKEKNAVIGGEGNGGIILPELHYGRDALVGIALFLTHLSKLNISCSDLRKKYPDYFMSKEKVDLSHDLDVDSIIDDIRQKYSREKISSIDGLKIDFVDSWVQLRKSNTEPIIRVYSEAKSQKSADELSAKFISEIKNFS